MRGDRPSSKSWETKTYFESRTTGRNHQENDQQKVAEFLKYPKNHITSTDKLSLHIKKLAQIEPKTSQRDVEIWKIPHLPAANPSVPQSRCCVQAAID